MKVVVIGGTGHIGTFLTPRLIEAGHQVTVVSRQQSNPYQKHVAWQNVRMVTLDRDKLEQQKQFGQAIADLAPEVVIDLICYQVESARQIVNALQDRVEHFLHCGTIWVHGFKVETPSEEWHPRRPIGEYGIRKAAIEAYLLEEVDQNRLPITILHPGHIVGPGWDPINPVGNFNRTSFFSISQWPRSTYSSFRFRDTASCTCRRCSCRLCAGVDKQRKGCRGKLPYFVREGYDVARVCGSYCRMVWSKSKPAVCAVGRISWGTIRKGCGYSWNHLIHSSSGSIEKARRLLNYRPQYSSLEAIRQSLSWTIENY
jgi:nucleoside-diphosphate-sugar epimerase